MLPQDQNQLSKYSSLIALSDPSYLRDKKSENHKFIKKRLLKLTDVTVIDGVDMTMLMIESGIYSSVSGSYQSVIGTTKEIDTVEIAKYVQSLIATGKVGIKLVSSDGKERSVEVVKAGNYFQAFDQGIQIWNEIVLYVREEKSAKKIYAIVRSFYPGYNLVKLYETKDGSLKDAKEIPLTSLTETAAMQEREQTGMSIPAFVEVSSGERYFEKIASMVDSIDRRLTQIELEFYKHLDAIMLYKGISIPNYAITTGSDGVPRLDVSKLGKVFIADTGDASIEYIKNDNPMIESAMEYIDRDLARISSITHVPKEFLGVESKEGAVGSESRTLRMSVFFAKVETLREKLAEAYATLTNQSLTFSPIVGYENDTNAGARNRGSIQNETAGV